MRVRKIFKSRQLWSFSSKEQSVKYLSIMGLINNASNANFSLWVWSLELINLLLLRYCLGRYMTDVTQTVLGLINRLFLGCNYNGRVLIDIFGCNECGWYILAGYGTKINYTAIFWFIVKDEKIFYVKPKFYDTMWTIL